MNKKILLIILIIISLLTSCICITSENGIKPVETLAQDQEMDTIETIKEPEIEIETEIKKPQA